MSALLFLYRRVLEKPLPRIDDIVRARRPRRLPVVLTREEVRMVFQRLEGTPLLVCRLLYGSGMRVLEALRLRVKDLDFGANQIVVREGKGRTWCFPVQSGKRADPATCTLAHEKIDFDYVALVAVLADFQLAT